MIPRRSNLYTVIKDTYGWHLGESLADTAERRLKDWQIEPGTLQHHADKRGHNTLLFTLDDKLAIKVVNALETHQKLPAEAKPMILQRIGFATLGYDQGMVPIHLEAYPYLQTEGVESHHVKALCYELYKHGLLFRDNKPANVGLTREGIPYVVDDGSIIPIAALPPGDPPFIYPQHSGFVRQGIWEEEASGHRFHWPEKQRDMPEFQAAYAFFPERKSVEKPSAIRC